MWEVYPALTQSTFLHLVVFMGALLRDIQSSMSGIKGLCSALTTPTGLCKHFIAPCCDSEMPSTCHVARRLTAAELQHRYDMNNKPEVGRDLSHALQDPDTEHVHHYLYKGQWLVHRQPLLDPAGTSEKMNDWSVTFFICRGISSWSILPRCYSRTSSPARVVFCHSSARITV